VGGAFIRKTPIYTYSKLISIECLLQAWEEFRVGKRKRYDVQKFERFLEKNLFNLQYALSSKTYRHGGYSEFYVNDPKRRHIHKADVQSRVVHHLLYKHMYGLFDKTFIYDSYSCRLGKGTHKVVLRLEKFARKVSKNYTQNCWALKCDIKKFFASVDHEILFNLLKTKIKDKDILLLIKKVIDSFHSERGEEKGIPLGNLTSQIFANIYLNALDQFIKNSLKIKYYLRYADDFIILDTDKRKFRRYIIFIEKLLEANSKLKLHPNKICIRNLEWGIDFCGYIVLPHYTLPRTKTKIRIIKKIVNGNASSQAFQSYLGYFSHAHSFKIIQDLKNFQNSFRHNKL